MTDVIAASINKQAFELVEIELEKYFLSLPEIVDISLYEKKKIRSGAGFVLHEQETILDKEGGRSRWRRFI